MSFIPSHKNQFVKSELEFLAENYKIEIEPLFRMSAITLNAGSFGPFLPPQPISVPLWLAMLLKKKRKCKVIPPSWLSVDSLEKLNNSERSEKFFAKLPEYYLEVSKMLFESASDDIPEAPTLQSILKDLTETRKTKVRAGLSMLTTDYLQLDNLTSFEINRIKPAFSKAFKTLTVLKGVKRPLTHTQVEDSELKIRKVNLIATTTQSSQTFDLQSQSLTKFEDSQLPLSSTEPTQVESTSQLYNVQENEQGVNQL